MDILTGTYQLKELDKINIILGKNGCGKSTLMRQIESHVAGDQQTYGKTRYITPERGGSLVYEAGVEQNSLQNINWLGETRRTNQFTQFRQQSIAQYRKLKDVVLERLETATQNGQTPLPPSFNQYITRINQLLDNIEIRRVDAVSQSGAFFTIHDKQSGQPIQAGQISSGEAELISLGIECLIFEQECIPNKTNLLFLIYVKLIFHQKYTHLTCCLV
jgi:predicted ATPase